MNPFDDEMMTDIVFSHAENLKQLIQRSGQVREQIVDFPLVGSYRIVVNRFIDPPLGYNALIRKKTDRYEDLQTWHRLREPDHSN